MKAQMTSFTFLLFFLSILIAKAQFPAPVNFDLQSPNIGIDNFFYLSWDPPTGNVGYYKIFRNNLLIDSCSATTYKDTVEFYYFCKYNISAVYFDPPGASNPDSCWAANIVLDIIKSPFIEEFESFFYHTWGNITEHGKGSWFLSNADYHSGSQSVKFNGLQEGDSASFFSTHIVAGYSPQISLWYKTPGHLGNFDELFFKVNDQEAIKLPLSEYWNQYEITYTDSILILEIFIYGAYKEGGGIFIDDIAVDDVSFLPKDFSFSERSILILPNPYRDNLTIFIESKKETVLQFDLINSIGQIIYSEHLRVYQGDNVYNFNTNNFPKGIQIAKFHNSEFTSNVILIKN